MPFSIVHSPAASAPAGFASRWLFRALAFSLAIVTALMATAALVVRPIDRSNLPFVIALLLALVLRLGTRATSSDTMRRIGDFAEYCALLMVIMLLGALSTYPLAAESHGFRDAGLAAIDRAIGFDWIAWYRIVAAHPALQTAGRIAYQSYYASAAILLGWCAWRGKRRVAERFLFTFWLAAFMTLLLFPLMPAIGPLGYEWRGAIPYMPTSALWQPLLIPVLRDHALHAVDLGSLQGLVSAPSFHTVAAILLIAAAWPQRALRWLLLTVNLAMLWSTPIEGTHYLADMLIGAVVAAAALLIVAALERVPAHLRSSSVAEPAAR